MTEERNTAEYLRAGLADGRFVAAHTLSDQFEKDLIEQALNNAGIPHAMRLTGESEFALIFEEMIREIRRSDEDAEETVRQLFDGKADR